MKNKLRKGFKTLQQFLKRSPSSSWGYPVFTNPIPFSKDSSFLKQNDNYSNVTIYLFVYKICCTVTNGNNNFKGAKLRDFYTQLFSWKQTDRVWLRFRANICIESLNFYFYRVKKLAPRNYLLKSGFLSFQYGNDTQYAPFTFCNLFIPLKSILKRV